MHPNLSAIEIQPHGLIRADVAAAIGSDRHLRDAFESHELLRLRRNVYAERATWRALGANARHALRMHAFALTHAERPIFTHHSSAALWGMPTIGEWPSTMHVAASAGTRGRTKGDVHEHVLPDGVKVVTRGGELLTSAADTVVGLACMLPFADAVAIADFALHEPRGGTALCARAELEQSLSVYRGRKGHAAARAVVRFADGLSGSLGESHSRANMHLCGFVIPELQVPFYDSRGLIGITDFYWRPINRIGEFDGLGKYLREEFAQGKDPARVVVDEKIREDRLRACGPSMSRWLFDVAISPRKLGDLLHEVGVPLAR